MNNGKLYQRHGKQSMVSKAECVHECIAAAAVTAASQHQPQTYRSTVDRG